MQKVSRKSIEFLLSTKPGGEIPSIGLHILSRLSQAKPGEPDSLNLASDYYDSIEELREKGLVENSTEGYRLTDFGKIFLYRLRDERRRAGNGETAPAESLSTPPVYRRYAQLQLE